MTSGVDLRFFCLALRWLVRRYGDALAEGDQFEEVRKHVEEAEAAYRRIVEIAARAGEKP